LFESRPFDLFLEWYFISFVKFKLTIFFLCLFFFDVLTGRNSQTQQREIDKNFGLLQTALRTICRQIKKWESGVAWKTLYCRRKATTVRSSVEQHFSMNE
jgi:hypothetical protein